MIDPDSPNQNPQQTDTQRDTQTYICKYICVCIYVFRHTCTHERNPNQKKKQKLQAPCLPASPGRGSSCQEQAGSFGSGGWGVFRVCLCRGRYVSKTNLKEETVCKASLYSDGCTYNIQNIYIYIYIYICSIYSSYTASAPHVCVHVHLQSIHIYCRSMHASYIYIYIYIYIYFFRNLLVLFEAGRLAQHEFGIVWPRVGCCSVAFVLWHMLFTYCFDSDSGLYWFCYSCSRRSACVGLRTRLIITIFLVDDLALQGLARKAVSAGLCSQIHL